MSGFETKPGVRIPTQKDHLPKRFYKVAGVAEGEGGYAVTLDGRPVRTPMKRPLAFPTAALAADVAAEWDAQGERINPVVMPLTRLAHGAIDAVPGNRDAVVAEVLKYAGTDLTRHRAEAPADLVTRQARAWDPALRFAEETLGAHLPAVTGILPAATSPAALAAFKDRADGYDDWQLAVLGHATAVTTSAVLGFMLCEGVLSGEEIFAASRIDETWQAEHWGEDSEAAERAEVLRTELVACARLLAAL